VARQHPKQLPLTPRRPNLEHPGWGGPRNGAGRKPSKTRRVPHSQRPQHQQRHPVHVTLRIEKSLGQLRTKLKLRALKAALRGARARRKAFRVIHFSLMSTHVHLIVEAADKDELTNGMRALEIGIARRFNQIVGRTGPVLADRYHARPLKTPREVRAGLAYVLLNSRHHGTPSRTAFIDPCSSGRVFDGWSRRCALPPGHVDDDDDLGPSTAVPELWLLRIGWRKHHPLISPDEVPGPR
jgi:REP element-mobilizing transposase RayT